MENYFPGDEFQGINANSGMPIYGEGQVTTVDQSGNAQPFGHLQRLADKLLGGVEFAIDQAIDNSARRDSVTKPVSGQLSFLPQSLASYVERNFTALVIGAVAILLGMVFFSGKRG